jgi:hypothetical protein
MPAMAADSLTVLTDAVRVRELNVVLRACEDVGARPLVFKGAALAHTHYAASWQRPRADADVLIAEARRQEVFSQLQRLGYERRTFTSGRLVTYQAPFWRRDHLGIEHDLDIHWRIVNPQAVSQALKHDELVERSVLACAEGYPIRVPSPVDSLLLACGHRIAHHPGDEQRVWLEDIHLLASRLGSSEWEAFVARAASRSIRAICLDGLTKAREKFQTVVPVDAFRSLSEANGEASAVFLRPGLRPIDGLAADVRALGPMAGAHLLREHLFPPAEYMQAKYASRRRGWLPAFYASRILSGVWKWFTPLEGISNQESGIRAGEDPRNQS